MAQETLHRHFYNTDMGSATHCLLENVLGSYHENIMWVNLTQTNSQTHYR